MGKRDRNEIFRHSNDVSTVMLWVKGTVLVVLAFGAVISACLLFTELCQ